MGIIEKQLKKDSEMKVNFKHQELIRSQLNRAEASLKQLKESDIFTEADREILIPRYQNEINLLKEKLSTVNQ